VEVAVFGDRSFNNYLSERLPEISTESSNMTDEEIGDKFKDIVKIVMKSSQAYFEVTTKKNLNVYSV
jgi:hypothetical protein